MKAEYRTHASDLKLELFNKLSSILMNIYNTNIWDYITDFHDILDKLKIMKYELNEWYVNNWFISELHNWQSAFIQMKKNELRNQDKRKINEINWDQIMNLLIIRMINYENKNKNKKFNSALKAETSEFKINNKDKNKSETKFKKSNKISMSISDNAEKKKLTYINYNYYKRWHS